MDSISQIVKNTSLSLDERERLIYKELEKLIVNLNSEILTLRSRNKELSNKIMDLEDESGKTPSGDGSISSIKYRGTYLHRLNKSDLIEASENIFNYAKHLEREVERIRKFSDIIADEDD